MFKPVHHCGLFAIIGHPEAASICKSGLIAQNHRGRDSGGIVTRGSDGKFHCEVCEGIVQTGITDEKLSSLTGDTAIGHVRYSTAGDKGTLANAQPLRLHTKFGLIALAHNGNFPYLSEIREALEQDGACFMSTTDSEVVLQLIARSKAPTVDEAIKDALSRVVGAYCLLILTENSVYAIRDPNGVHPLVLGDLYGKYVIASETCAFLELGATCLREIEPGEIVKITGVGLESWTSSSRVGICKCFFNLEYFGWPSSDIFGRNVAAYRMEVGKILATEAPPPPGSIILPVPNSGNYFGFGYANESKRPISGGLLRTGQVRSFLEPTPEQRSHAVRRKFNAIPELVRDEIVVLVDDSLVRSTTMTIIVAMLFEAGAREVHVRIACPPIRSTCPYGIDMASLQELVAAHMSEEQIRLAIGADSLRYLSVEGLHEALEDTGPVSQYCTACITGRYPIEGTGPVSIPLLQLAS